MASIKQLPSGSWRARVRRLGERAQSATFSRKADAEAWGRKRESEIERGRWNDNTLAESTTLVEALDKYETEVVSRMRGQRGERSIVGILRDEPIADKCLANIVSADVAAMRDRWSNAGLKAGSIRRRMHTLSHLFTVARREWGMGGLDNPTRDVKLAPDDPGRERRVSEKELDAVRAAGRDTLHLPDFVTLAVETAMRREELVNARWRDVTLMRDGVGTLYIPATKNGTPRTVPLSEPACKALASMTRRKDGRVFGWKRPDSATQAFVRAVRRARKEYEAKCEAKGVEPTETFLVDLRLHDLRHEAISRLAPRFKVHELARITGHKTLSMLMRYYHADAADFAKRLKQRRGT